MALQITDKGTLEKKINEIKKAQQTLAESTLTLWNARLEAMQVTNTPLQDIMDHMLTNVCGCPEPGSPKCGCSLNMNFGEDRINEMHKAINEIALELKLVKEKIK